MRRILLLAALALASLKGQTTALDRFAGKHLTETDQQALLDLAGEVPKSYLTNAPPTPWRVWKLTGNSRTRYVMLLGAIDFAIPGGTSASIELFDAAGTRLNAVSFQTGWRSYPGDPSCEVSRDLGTDVIVLNMSWVINGRHIAKEYFAIDHDRILLVRLEDDKGQAHQNEYN